MLGKLFARGGEGQAPQLPLLFSLTNDTSLRLAADYEPYSAWRFLSHHIKRHPQDLRAHVQRILLAQADNSLNNRLAGSIQDLYLTLDDAGIMLREHVLRLTHENLSEETHAFFRNWLDQGAGGNDHQWRQGSILTTGQGSEPITLIEIHRTEATSQYSSVMEEVQACMEYGQIDVAQDLLEKEISNGNISDDIEQELLSIYQYTRAKDNLQAMTATITESGQELSAAWQNMLQEAESW